MKAEDPLPKITLKSEEKQSIPPSTKFRERSRTLGSAGDPRMPPTDLVGLSLLPKDKILNSRDDVGKYAIRSQKLPEGESEPYALIPKDLSILRIRKASLGYIQPTQTSLVPVNTPEQLTSLLSHSSQNVISEEDTTSGEDTPAASSPIAGETFLRKPRNGLKTSASSGGISAYASPSKPRRLSVLQMPTPSIEAKTLASKNTSRSSIASSIEFKVTPPSVELDVSSRRTRSSISYSNPRASTVSIESFQSNKTRLQSIIQERFVGDKDLYEEDQLDSLTEPRSVKGTSSLQDMLSPDTLSRWKSLFNVFYCAHRIERRGKQILKSYLKKANHVPRRAGFLVKLQKELDYITTVSQMLMVVGKIAEDAARLSSI